MKYISIILVLLLSTIMLLGQELKPTTNLDIILQQLELTSEQQKKVNAIKVKYTENKKVYHASSYPIEEQSKIEVFQKDIEKQRNMFKEIRKVLTQEQLVKMRHLRGAKKIDKT